MCLFKLFFFIWFTNNYTNWGGSLFLWWVKCQVKWKRNKILRPVLHRHLKTTANVYPSRSQQNIRRVSTVFKTFTVYFPFFKDQASQDQSREKGNSQWGAYGCSKLLNINSLWTSIIWNCQGTAPCQFPLMASSSQTLPQHSWLNKDEPA